MFGGVLIHQSKREKCDCFVRHGTQYLDLFEKNTPLKFYLPTRSVYIFHEPIYIIFSLNIFFRRNIRTRYT